MNFLNTLNGWVWGPPLLILLVGTGLFLTIQLGLLQITKLPLALKYLFTKDEDDDSGEGDVSVLQLYVPHCPLPLEQEIL